MELPPSLIQASIPSSFLAPTLTHRVLDTTIASTITSITVQMNPVYVSTLVGSTIQTNIVYGSTTISNNIEIDTLLSYSLAGNAIQTDTMLTAALTGSTIQTNTLYVISLHGSTIQTNTCNAQTVSSNTIQMNTITTSTVTGNIQSNTYVTSTLIGSTIQSNLLRVAILNGSTIQTNTIKVSTIIGSSIQGNQLHTNILEGSTIHTNVFQPTTLQVSTLSGGNIQASITSASTLLLTGSTFQSNNFNFNTITGSTIQANAVNVSTLLGNTIIGCTIQVAAVSCSTVSGSTIQVSKINLSTLIGNTIQIRQGTVSTTQYSTLTGSTIQTNQLNGSTISASTIQSNITQASSLVGGTLQISTLSISSLIGSTIQTNILQVSTLSGSTIQVAILQVSTLSGSTIQTLQLNISTLVCSTIQTDRLDGSTILYSTIQTNTLYASTIRCSTIVGSTIQTTILQGNAILCSTIIGSNFNTNKILTTDGSKALTTSNIDASNLSYITNLTSQAGGQGQTNTWTGAQTFSTVDIYMNGLTTETPSHILGINASNQLVKFTKIPEIQGIVSLNYIPYALNTSVLSNSIIYRVNTTDVAIGKTTSAFPKSLTIDSMQVYGEYLTFDLGAESNYHNNFYYQLAEWTTPYQIHFAGSDDNISWISLGIDSVQDLTANYKYTLSNKRYLRMIIIQLYNDYEGGIPGNRQMLLYSPAISRDGGTNLFVDINQLSLSPNLTQGVYWQKWIVSIYNTQYTGEGTTGQLGTYTGTIFTAISQESGGPTPYTLSVAGNTQAANVIAESGTFAKIDTPDKRAGVNGLQIPGNQGCHFYMGTMNNNNSGNYTDTLYLNSIPTIDMTDSFNVYNNIVVASTGATSGTGFQTMPSFTPSATGLTFSALIILTGPTMPVQWARIFDMGNLSQAPTRGFNIAFNSGGTLHWEYRASDSTLTQGNTTIQLALNIMYHVVWTIDTLGNHVLYINGQQAATMTKVISLDTYPYFYLGKSNWIADPYPNMTMFDFRMMNRSLSSLDVIGLYYSVKKISGTSILSGQYILLNRPNGEYLNLAEIQVFSYEGGPNIITPSTSVSFPDLHSSYSPYNFIDGNFNTMIHSNGLTNSTVTINLGATFPIYKIVIYNRIDCCWNRANGIVLTIKNSSNTTVYTASPIPDKLGRTTVQTDTSNLTDYYYTFTYFPPYAAVIGNIENIESPMCKVNAVMFNKGTPGMRIYQGANQASVSYTAYKDLVVTDVNSGNLSWGSGSDTNGIILGPSATTPSYLKVGSGTDRSGTNIAQVIVTNGNLHIDCASNGKTLYLNKNVITGSNAINSYTPLTHYNSLSVTGNISSSSIKTADWYYIKGSAGMNWSKNDREICSPEKAENLYGNVSTRNNGKNSYAGWGIGTVGAYMGANNEFGINNCHLSTDTKQSWLIRCNGDNLRSTTLAGSVMCSQAGRRFRVFFNGVNEDAGYYSIEGSVEGNGVIGGSGAFFMPANVSDERIKKNIKPIDPNASVDFINGVIPSFYCLKEAEPCMQKKADGTEEMVYPSVCSCEQCGFIAQNVLESTIKAGLPKSTINGWYDYEQELLLPEEQRKTILGVSVVPLTCHLVNALKAKIKLIKEQQEKISMLQHKLETSKNALNNIRETVRQQTELLQQVSAKP
jgi:hypothetical protein